MRRVLSARFLQSVALFVTIASSSAGLASPGLSHYGRLLDAADRPVTGTYDVRFALYSQASGGVPVWEEDWRVSFENGHYAVLLGDAEEGGDPIDPSLLSGALWLGIRIGGEGQAELQPRQRLASAAWALRARVADSLSEGVTIHGARLSGGSVDVDSLKIGGVPIFDETGAWVAPPGTVPIPTLDGVVMRDGDQVIDGSVTGQRFISTEMVGPPLEVASDVLVENLNAHKLGGVTVEELVRVAELETSGFANLARNGSFELDDADDASLASWGLSANVTGAVVSGARYGTRALSLSSAGVEAAGARQVLLDSDHAAGFVGSIVTASAWVRRVDGTSHPRLCLRDAPVAARTSCASAVTVASDAWTRLVVHHQVGPEPLALEVLLLPTGDAGEEGTHVFDGVMVTEGQLAPAFAARSDDLLASLPPAPVLEIADGSIGTAKLADGAVVASKLGAGAVGPSALALEAVEADALAAGSVTREKLAAGAVDALRIDADAVTAYAIAEGAVLEDKLADGAVTGAKLGWGVVDSLHLADGSVTADKLAPGAVGVAEIGEAAVLRLHIAPEAVDADRLAPGAVTSEKLAALSVGSGALIDGAVASSKLADGAVFGSKLADGSVEAIHLRNGAVGEAALASGAVTASKLREGAVAAAALADGAVTFTKLGDEAVGEMKIAAGAISSSRIRDGAVGAAKLAGSSVGAGHIVDDAITSSKLANGAVLRDKLGLGAVDADRLADGAVSAAKLALNAVGSSSLQDEAVTSVKLAQSAVTSDKLGTGAVVEGKIATGAVTVAALKDGAVVGAKLADGAVGPAKLASNAVGTDALANDAVTGLKLADGAVTTNKIRDGQVTGAKLAPGSINGSRLTDGTVGTLQLAAVSVTRGKLADGAVDETKLAAKAVTTSRIADAAITELLLGNGAVTTDKLGNGAVTHDKLAAGAVRALHLGNGAVDGLKLADGAVSAGHLATNAVGPAALASNAASLAKVSGGGLSWASDRLEVAGALRVGAIDVACIEANEGLLRFNAATSALELCIDAGWTPIGDFGAGRVVQAVHEKIASRVDSDVRVDESRGVELGINKRRANTQLVVRWSMTVGFQDRDNQIYWRRGAVNGGIVATVGASSGHATRDKNCSVHSGFFVLDTTDIGPVSFHLTYGRLGNNGKRRMVLNCDSNESNQYEQSESWFTIEEVTK